MDRPGSTQRMTAMEPEMEARAVQSLGTKLAGFKVEARVPVVSLGAGWDEARECGKGAGAEFASHGPV